MKKVWIPHRVWINKPFRFSFRSMPKSLSFKDFARFNFLVSISTAYCSRGMFNDTIAQINMAVTKKATNKKRQVVRKSRAKNVSSTEALEVKEVSPKINFKGLKFSKKVRYTLVGVLSVGLLLLLLGKYMVVAWVDNKPVTRFEYYSVMDKKFGNETRENLIVEKLFMSEAAKRRVSVTNQEVSDEIKKIEERAGGADQLAQALQANGMSQEDLNQRIKLELLKQKMFGEGITVSDEELDKYIEENKQSLPTTITDNTSSESARLKEGLKEQLKQQKVDEDFNKWLSEVLKSSRVVRS